MGHLALTQTLPYLKITSTLKCSKAFYLSAHTQGFMNSHTLKGLCHGRHILKSLAYFFQIFNLPLSKPALILLSLLFQLWCVSVT